ncbi:ferroxidase fet3 [Mycoemilia scoparia]|uniref:Ferroxidase fet3 n=1 Tax=Mycoemilia scoparia TaxID=417184 RepID=A0A9W8DV62_9FUNG|nr:ferroxidase fet3 [Mycoemilia scoparia]
MVASKDLHFDWDINYVTAKPDGKQEQQVIGCNNAWPFPQIEAEYGDVLHINVHNSLDMATSLHSHGIFFHGLNEYDGAVGVTECGIPPGKNYTYTIPLNQWGTYWIHSHSGAQYVEGWRTSLVIHPPKDKDPFKYDGDYTLPLSDWFYESATALGDHFLSLQNPGGGEPSPDAALIREGATTSINFEPGKTYRLRFINYSAAAIFFINIDDHEMKIIEVDGVDVEPTTAKTIMIAAAQRYSVLVTAKNSTDSNYLIHADLDVDKLDTLKDHLLPNITATIVYDDNADTADPPARDWVSFNDLELTPIVKSNYSTPDQSIDLTVTFNQLDDGMFYGMFNDITYLRPKVPSLLTMLTTGEYATDATIYGKMTNTYVFEQNKTIEIVLLNGDPDPHPFHLHGNTFQVVARGDVMEDYDPKNIPDNPNPMRRDTVVLPGNGYAVLRFFTDNIGSWFFHCHNEWHMIAGLAAVFNVDPVATQKQLTFSDTMKEFCAANDFLVEGNAMGKQGLDLAGQPEGPNPINYSIHGSGIGAMAACVISAVLGILAIIWYSLNDPATNGDDDGTSTPIVTEEFKQGVAGGRDGSEGLSEH